MTISIMIIGIVYSVLLMGITSFQRQSTGNLMRQDAVYVMTTVTNYFYDTQGTGLPEVRNGQVYVDEKEISSDIFDYSGSSFAYDQDKSLKIILKITPRDNDPNVKPLELHSLLYYPW